MGVGGRREGAGRPKGAIGRRTVEFLEEVHRYCELHDVSITERLVELVGDSDKQVALAALKIIMPHVHPKLRSIEWSAGDGEGAPPRFELIIQRDAPTNGHVVLSDGERKLLEAYRERQGH